MLASIRRAKPLNVPKTWHAHAAVPLPGVSAVWLTRTPTDPLYTSHGQIVVDWKDGHRSVYQCASRFNARESELVTNLRLKPWSFDANRNRLHP